MLMPMLRIVGRKAHVEKEGSERQEGVGQLVRGIEQSHGELLKLLQGLSPMLQTMHEKFSELSAKVDELHCRIEELKNAPVSISADPKLQEDLDTVVLLVAEAKKKVPVVS